MEIILRNASVSSAKTWRFVVFVSMYVCAALYTLNASVPLEGTYSFFDKPGYHFLAGHGKLSLTRSGSFTGGIAILSHLSYGLDTRPDNFVFKGKLRSDGTTDLVLSNAGGTAIVAAALHLHTRNSKTIDGHVVIRFYGGIKVVHWFSAELAAPAGVLEGRYTSVLSTPKRSFTEYTPSDGHGWMLVTVRADGRVVAAGRLPTGPSFVTSSRLREDGAFHFYTGRHVGLLPIDTLHPDPRTERSQSSNDGEYSFHRDMYGLITLHEKSDSDGSGFVIWEEFHHEKYSNSLVTIDTSAEVEVSRFVPPVPGQFALKFPRGTQSGNVDVFLRTSWSFEQSRFSLILQDGSNEVVDLRPPIEELTFTLMDDQPVGMAGSFKGVLQFANENTPRGFSGVVLQKQNVAKGFFKGLGFDAMYTGSVRMTPAKE